MAKHTTRWTGFNPNRLLLNFSTPERAAIERRATELKIQPVDLAHAYVVQGLKADGFAPIQVERPAPPPVESGISDEKIERMFGKKVSGPYHQ
jgi:hypothetical protein